MIIPIIAVAFLLLLGNAEPSQVFLRAGGNNNDPFRSSWADDISLNNDPSAPSSGVSKRPSTGPGSRDMNDVCSRRCRCSGERLEFVTCSHLDDFGPLQDEFACPNRIETLILNNITFKASRAGFPVRLDANNFTDFRQLTTLRIVNSSCINIINYSAFLPSRNRLKNIVIINSRLQRIESGAFAYLDLDTLDISDNRLYYHQKISPGTFQDARAIRTLILRNTSLSSLPTSVLAPIAASLTSLDISFNRLHTLSSDLIPVFCQLGKLAMSNNTWCCAKPGRWLSLFLRLTLDQLPDKIVGTFPPTCEGGPRPMRGRPISDVSYEEMDKYETCEGLLGPRDPKTCQELLAKFHEMFAVDNTRPASLVQSIQQQQQEQINNALDSITPPRTVDRQFYRQKTTTLHDEHPLDADEEVEPSSPSAWDNARRQQHQQQQKTTSTVSPPGGKNEYDEGEEEEQIYIAGASKHQTSDGETKTGQSDDEMLSNELDEESDIHGDFGNHSRRRGALSSPSLTCGFVDCTYIVYAVVAAVGFVALVGAGIGVYTMAIRHWRNRSRQQLVERITS